MSLLNPFYDAIAWLVVHIQADVTHGAGKNWSWVLAIVLLVIAMRILLFPLFVKQIKTQRAMQVLQPKMKELQAKYKHDREKLNQEMMKLYREHGANPLSGCLPLIVQMPVFFALFHTLNGFHPQKTGCVHPFATTGAAFSACWHGFSNIDAHTVQQASIAKIFGTPIAAAFTSSHHTLQLLSADPTSVKILTAVLIVVMGATTFFTQRQLLARTAASNGAPQANTQRTLMLVLPLFFTLFGFKFQLGVLLYWLTNNTWTMGQQFFVIRRMNPAPAAPSAGAIPPPAAPRGPAPGQQPRRPGPGPTAAGGGARSPGDSGRPQRPPAPTPGAGRSPSGNRSRRNRRGRRR